MSDQEKSLATARIWQPLVCLGLLAGIGLAVMAMEAAIRNEALGVWWDRKWAEANEGESLYRRLYVDNEDRAILEELEDLDVSRGGVYFFGGSNLMWATRVPDLPPPQRCLVHNFGVGGESSARYVRQYVEFLVKHKNLLQAGADKSLIVFGTCFLNIKPPRDQPGNVFTNMWRRRGFYRYDLETGIEPVPVNDFLHRYLVRKGRYASLVHACLVRFERGLVPKALRRTKRSKNAEVYAADYRQRLGTHWQEDLARAPPGSPGACRLREGPEVEPCHRAPAAGQLAPVATLSAQVSGHDRGILLDQSRAAERFQQSRDG